MRKKCSLRPSRSLSNLFRFFITVWQHFFNHGHKLSHICVVHGGYSAGFSFVRFFYLSSFACLCTAEHNVFPLLYPRTVSHYRSIETSSQVTHKELNPRAFSPPQPVQMRFLLFSVADRHNLREYFSYPSPHTHRRSELLQASIFINPPVSDMHPFLFH